MKRRYSRRFDPPAPTLAIRVHGAAGSEQLEGLVDTGSDICAVPRAVADMLDLRPVRLAQVAGVHGRAELIVYRVHLQLADRLIRNVEALAADRPYALLGRNLLRRLELTLDGPKGWVEVRCPLSA